MPLRKCLGDCFECLTRRPFGMIGVARTEESVGPLEELERKYLVGKVECHTGTA